jgi:hypothetical protein
VASPTDVELKFSRDAERASFPSFCNSLIALEAPRTRTFPILTTKAGPDGGMDGEWDLTGVDGFVPVSIATAGWNVYQFKTLDVPTLGEQKAFSTLCRGVRGAVTDIIARQAQPKALAKYVLFTNLRLGLESESTTTDKRSLSTRRAQLREEVLKGSTGNVDITIIDADQISGFVARHPALRMGWFSPGQGTAWNEMRQRARRLSSVDVPLIGRDTEFADIQGWLGDPDVRVIAVSGPNSVGKTRLVIEATEQYAPVTFFAEDVHALSQYGVGTYATAERVVVLVIEDPPAEMAKRLAEQAVGCDKPIKLIFTLPSPDHAPVVRLGDNSVVKPRQIPRLAKEVATRLVESVNADLEHRLRDWIVQQAGGIPGVLVEAAALGEELHREAGSLRKQLSQKFRHSLETKAGRDALLLLKALSPLVYVRVIAQSSELQVLLSHIAPEVQLATVLHRLSEFEALGFLRRQGEYVAVVPPMFAAGLFHDVATDNPSLPEQLMAGLDLAGRKRLLERLVTVELPHATPFTSFVFGPAGPFGDAERFGENLELLDYLARALPQETARFLHQRLAEIWRDVVHRGQNGMQSLLSAVNELLDEPATTALAFAILTELATREALESDATAAADDFVECFVYWYPRSMSYQEREAALEPMLASADLTLRKVGLKAVITATHPPDSLGGRSVTARRLGSKPRYGTWKDNWDFVLRMMRRRLATCLASQPELRAMALHQLPHAISRLGGHLRIEDAMQMVREISEPYFLGTIQLDPLELRENVKWLRGFYERSSEKPGQEKWRERWNKAIGELDTLLLRLEQGPFDHRLRLAIGRTYDHDEAVFDDRKLYQYQVRILQLAREACREPHLMTNGTWGLLGEKGSLNGGDFALFLGECDETHSHFPVLLARAVDWQWARLLGLYLAGAMKSGSLWVDTALDEMLACPSAPKNGLLTALRVIGPTETNRLRLKQLLRDHAVSADDVANAFSSGRWLDGLPVEEVRDVLNFILSEPDHELAMINVASLYLHHHRPLPRELFDTVVPVLNGSTHARMRSTYECDQVATGLAMTDLEAGLQLLREGIRRLSDAKSKMMWWTGWNPFERYGTRDFWEYLRTQSPERAYKILGERSVAAPGPDLQDHGKRYLLDLASHQQILVDIALSDRNAARIFAQCIPSAQPGFFPFAYQLVEMYPNDEAVIGALNSALIQTSGFGYEYDWLTEASDTLDAQRKMSGLSGAAQRWLESLQEIVLARRSGARRDFGPSEPSFLD